VTVDRTRLAGRLAGRLFAGGYVGIDCTCSGGDWPAATYTIGLAVGETMATAACSRTATLLSGTLNLNTRRINQLWQDNPKTARRAMLYLTDRTPRIWMAQPVEVEYIEDQAYV
jgi:hypothetical protein